MSPSIPLNPDTPMSSGGWQRPFVPTNDLVLTRPVFHTSGDNELDDMVKRFNASAATSAASIMRAPLQERQHGFRPARRSYLRPTSRPVSLCQSAYPPPHGLKTWRKYPDSPAKPETIVKAQSEVEAATVGKGKDFGTSAAASNEQKQIVIEISSSSSSSAEN